MNILDFFRNEKNNNKGWLGIKGTALAIDKQKHIVAGILIMLVTTAIFLILGKNITHAIEQGVAVVFPFAIAKEVWDFIQMQRGKKKGWQPLPDIIATVLIPIVVQLLNLAL